MDKMIFAEAAGRIIPKEDKIFGISNRAKRATETLGKDKVINGTIGALMDEEGELMVLQSVDQIYRSLTPSEYAPYAPIGGTAGYKEAVKKELFGELELDSFTPVVATPGGTGSLHCAITNYSKKDEKILTTDWYWAPYGKIAQEVGRQVEVFEMFSQDGGFNIQAFKEKLQWLSLVQDRLFILLNTPAHNPTGYAIAVDEWQEIIDHIKTIDDTKVTLLVDVAYIDFAGEARKQREFFRLFENLPDNILVIVAYSMSKTYTLYGLRGGAAVAITGNQDIAEEFVSVMEYSARAAWSNTSRLPQVILEKAYADDSLLKKIDEERRSIRNMLLKRGRIFAEHAANIGLEMVPFRGGFFASIPTDKAEEICQLLEGYGVFLVPLAKGIRVSIASINVKQCQILPQIIKEAMDKIG